MGDFIQQLAYAAAILIGQAGLWLLENNVLAMAGLVVAVAGYAWYRRRSRRPPPNDDKDYSCT